MRFQAFAMFLLGVGLLACAGDGVSAQNQKVTANIPTVTIPRRAYHEQLKSFSNISSNAAIVGLMIGGGDVPIDGPELSIAGLQPSDKVICLAVEHVDGSYAATASFRNPNKGDRLRVRLPTRLFELRRGMRSGEIAILARVSPRRRCDFTDPIIAANWGRLPAKGTASVLLSVGPGAQAALSLAGLTSPIPCRSQASPDRLQQQRFNTACQIASGLPCRGSARYEVIVRVRGAQHSPANGVLRRDCLS